ncbi:MAG: hypothetical protein K8953_00845 [Proteobacteria bacterium]|nr:hypothetical protein [Pseudomonadota bacterium]
MFIKNYGLFWKRDDVFWGRRNNAGSLFGRPAENRTQIKVDFREQTGLYALYDAAFNLVYIGHAGLGVDQRLFERLQQHRRHHLSNRWSYFSWFGIKEAQIEVIEGENFYRLINIAEGDITGSHDVFLCQFEAVSIAIAEPRSNRQAGQFKGAIEYIQHRDSRLDE